MIMQSYQRNKTSPSKTNLFQRSIGILALVGALLALALIVQPVAAPSGSSAPIAAAGEALSVVSPPQSEADPILRHAPAPEAPLKRADSIAAAEASNPTPPSPSIVSGIDGANVRTGPGTHYERIGYLAPDEVAAVTGWSGSWWQIDYRGEPAWVYGDIVSAYNIESGVPEVEPPPSPLISSPTPVPSPTLPSVMGTGHWIDVDLSEQVLTAYEDWTPVRVITVSTGLPGTPTPVGQFRIWVKFRADDMEGPGYYLPDVPYAMYFHLGYGLHGTYWHNNFGQPMSHGCVNLPTTDAEWLFNWSEVGTLVNVHE
jgi:lipoprotein-anchoring transpeptidase ErfK/SrfK